MEDYEKLLLEGIEFESDLSSAITISSVCLTLVLDKATNRYIGSTPDTFCYICMVNINNRTISKLQYFRKIENVVYDYDSTVPLSITLDGKLLVLKTEPGRYNFNEQYVYENPNGVSIVVPLIFKNDGFVIDYSNLLLCPCGSLNACKPHGFKTDVGYSMIVDKEFDHDSFMLINRDDDKYKVVISFWNPHQNNLYGY